MNSKCTNIKDGVYTHCLYDETVEAIKNRPDTFVGILKNRLEEFPDKRLFGVIVNDETVKYCTTKEFYQQMKKLAHFLKRKTVERELFGIYAVNCLEWVTCEYGGYFANCVNVPLYSTFSPSSIEYVLNETKMKILFASAVKAKSLYENVLKNAKKIHLKEIILYEKDKEVAKLYKKLNIDVSYYNDLMSEEIEDESTEESGERLPNCEDLATICYTSGTSGNPKGVMMKHKAFSAHIAGYRYASEKGWFCKTSDVSYLSYLPLAHVFERICFSCVLDCGGTITFFRGNPKILQKDYEVAKPSFIAAVPRVLNLFEERIKQQVNELNFLKKFIFKICYWFKNRAVKRGQFKSWLVDKLVFNKISNKFGGKLENCLCGAAAINPDTLEFLQTVLSMKIIQGYGLTEGAAANIVQPCTCDKLDTVGIPFPTCKVMLQPVEQFTEENCGEVLLSGPSITEGYYAQEKLNEETFEVINGVKWLKTGDVMKFRNDRFYVVGRAKTMFKTSYGEYIVPDHVENVFTGDFIQDIFVSGTSFSDNLCAVVVITDKKWQDETKVLEYLKKKGLELVEQRKIVKYEIPSAVYIIDKDFATLENGELITPSMKKRRKLMFEYFKDEIEKRLSGKNNKF